jgi:hypothetical protein
MRNNYWSCTKFADWLRGTSKPKAGTEEEWHAWHASAKLRKLRYLVAENGLDFLQDFTNWPCDRMRNLRYYILNQAESENFGGVDLATHFGSSLVPCSRTMVTRSRLQTVCRLLAKFSHFQLG